MKLFLVNFFQNFKIKNIKKSAWIIIGVFLFILFTLFKLNTEKVDFYIHELLSQNLARFQLAYQSQSEELSFFLFPSYKLEKIKIFGPGFQSEAPIDTVSISPGLFSLLIGNFGATLHSQFSQNGKLWAKLSGDSNSVKAKYNIANVDIKESGILYALLQVFTSQQNNSSQLNRTLMSIFQKISGAFHINGQGQLMVDFKNISNSNGELRLSSGALQLPAQTIEGFEVPKIFISKCDIEIIIDNHKAIIRKIQLGESFSKNDSLIANLSGTIDLKQSLMMSPVELKLSFNLSQELKNSFRLIETLLAKGKQPDGSFILKGSGLLQSPVFAP